MSDTTAAAGQGATAAHRVRLPSFACGLLSLLALLAAAPERAEAVNVEFDIAYLAVCREVTNEEFSAGSPHEKLMEARFHISALLTEGSEKELVEFFYVLDSPQGEIQIVDYEPKTQLTSPVVGTLNVQTEKEKTHSVGLNVAAEPLANLHGSATAGASGKNGAKVRYDLQPRKELLAASGTLRRGRGVYFKLKPSAQTSLEGARQFSCVFRVPRTWRCDYVRVRCQARAAKGGWWPSHGLSDAGRAGFLVGLYQEGDLEAQLAVEDLLESERQLRKVVAAHKNGKANPSWSAPFGPAAFGQGNAMPVDWHERAISDPRLLARRVRTTNVPRAVRVALDRYVEMRQSLVDLNAEDG